MTVQKDSTYSEENIPTSSWAKFETVGDAVKGTFKEVFDKAGEGEFPDQKVYVLDNASVQKLEVVDKKVISTISTEDVGELNVGIKVTNSYLLQRLKAVKPGDKIAFAFLEEIEPKKKGYKPAKSIQIYKTGVDEEWLKQNQPGEELSIKDAPF